MGTSNRKMYWRTSPPSAPTSSQAATTKTRTPYYSVRNVRERGNDPCVWAFDSQPKRRLRPGQRLPVRRLHRQDCALRHEGESFLKEVFTSYRAAQIIRCCPKASNIGHISTQTHILALTSCSTRSTLTSRICTVRDQILEPNQPEPKEPDAQKLRRNSLILHDEQLYRMRPDRQKQRRPARESAGRHFLYG